MSSKDKRWKISEDESSRERIKTIKEIHTYLKTQVPDVTIGFTLFGSLSKGKKLDESTARETDIDLVIFIDDSELVKNFAKMAREHPESEFIRRMQQSTPFKETDLFILLRLFTIETFRNRFRTEETGQQLHLEFEEIGLKGKSSILAVADGLYKHKPKDDDSFETEWFITWSIRLSRYFHLDVGGSMKKYKDNFYQELAQRLAKGGRDAAEAESLWRNIVLAMKVEERHKRDLPNDLREKFPSDNLREFLTKQGIKIPTDSRVD